MSGDILDQIDLAIEDWTVGEDAMRWSHEPVDNPHCPGCADPTCREKLYRCPACRVVFASRHVWWVFGAPQSGALPGHSTGFNSAHRLEQVEA